MPPGRSRVPRAWRRVALQGEVVLLEEAAAQGRQEKAGQGQLTRGWASLLEEGGNREGGVARADRGLFSQLTFAFKVVLSLHLCFLLRWPRVFFCFCISINDMDNINQRTLKGKSEVRPCWRVSPPVRQRIKSLNRRGLSQGSSLFVLTAMVYWQRTGGCSSIRRGEV